MPKIRIQEFDVTGGANETAISNIIYIPIAESNAISTEPELIATKTQLDAYASGSASWTSSRQYAVCLHLINLGFRLLLQAASNATTLLGTGGVEVLKDKAKYDVRFITCGIDDTFRGKLGTAGIGALLTIASNRGDCIVLADMYDNSDWSWKASDLRSKYALLFPTTPTSYNATAKYGAVFAPDFTVNAIDEFKSLPAEDRLLPAPFAYLFAYGNMIKIKKVAEWFAVAGVERGSIPELAAVECDYGSADIEILQARAMTSEVDLDNDDDNVGFAINPIAFIRPSGYRIYGNRTLYYNNGELVASSFLNIRNGVDAIKKLLYEAARTYTFEQNTDVLWNNFKGYVTPLLDQMKYGNGLAGYKFTRVATTKKARLCARLDLVPIEAVEDFDIEVYLTDTLEVEE